MIQGMPEIIIEAHKEVIIICHVSPKYKHMKQAMPETIIAVQISMKNNLQRVSPLQILNR